MEKEKIIRVWRFAYIKLLGGVLDHNQVIFNDEGGKWESWRVFWRFHIVRKAGILNF